MAEDFIDISTPLKQLSEAAIIPVGMSLGSDCSYQLVSGFKFFLFVFTGSDHILLTCSRSSGIAPFIFYVTSLKCIVYSLARGKLKRVKLNKDDGWGDYYFIVCQG